MKRYSLFQQTSDGRFLLVYHGDPKLITSYTYTLDTLSEALTGHKSLLLDNHLLNCTHQLDFNDLSDISNLSDTHPELYL